MKLINLIINNLSDLFLLIGVLLISIGFFIWSIKIGFIVSGLLLVGLAFITLKDEGGD
ncbi:MAG TPA: hypothetical protein VEY70_11710 [Metabacillus sp.]|nr:hypothetical protein [Metabacillus sp.]